MISSAYLRTPTRLLVLFVVLGGLPLAALGWLTWRFLDQDRALEGQRIRERLENDASLLARESDRALAAWEDLLTASGPNVPATLRADGVFLAFNQKGILRSEGVALPYYPLVDPGPEAPSAIFATAEALEFREGALASATATYREIASTGDRPQRAAALMRLARCFRKQNQFQDALRTYVELAAMGSASVAGVPAEILATHERIAVWKVTGKEAEARREAASLAAMLSQGRFQISRATFDFYSQSAPLPFKSKAFELARAVEEFWPQWSKQPSGRAAVMLDGGAFASVWRQSAAGTTVIVSSINAMLAPVLPVARNLQVRLTLEDPAGHLLTGTAIETGEQAAKNFRETGLPWTIRVTPSDPDAAHRVWESRRNLLFAGFGLMALVIASAAYFVFRAVHRELAVAQLQSDFVSAVSHEFRTPLAAICHLTEVLEEGDASGDRLPQYYRALAKETRRLHSMVESLLDFGRMESGRRTYHMEETSATELVRQVVDEFRERAGGGAHRLAVLASPDPFVVCADHEAIALALRNLVDNAMKYSPESSPVEVSLARCGDLTGISVEDHGPGIPKEEQRLVFRKFVRGHAAMNMNVKGTGIGLALVDHIVKAHGGRVELASIPGQGSRFTILLPAQQYQQ